MIWFTSDWHLGHANIFRHSERQFDNTEDMDAHILDTCNHYVKRGDQLWHLGDWAWKASKYGHYRQRLKVKQFHCIRGNHDSSSLRQHCSSFNVMLVRKFQGRRFHLCHYPLVSWSGMEHGCIHLYGHCHGTREPSLDAANPDRTAIDVGIDNMKRALGEYRPISLEELLVKYDRTGTNQRP